MFDIRDFCFFCLPVSAITSWKSTSKWTTSFSSEYIHFNVKPIAHHERQDKKSQFISQFRNLVKNIFMWTWKKPLITTHIKYEENFVKLFLVTRAKVAVTVQLIYTVAYPKQRAKILMNPLSLFHACMFIFLHSVHTTGQKLAKKYTVKVNITLLQLSITIWKP